MSGRGGDGGDGAPLGRVCLGTRCCPPRGRGPPRRAAAGGGERPAGSSSSKRELPLQARGGGGGRGAPAVGSRCRAASHCPGERLRAGGGMGGCGRALCAALAGARSAASARTRARRREEKRAHWRARAPRCRTRGDLHRTFTLASAACREARQGRVACAGVGAGQPPRAQRGTTRWRSAPVARRARQAPRASSARCLFGERGLVCRVREGWRRCLCR